MQNKFVKTSKKNREENIPKDLQKSLKSHLHNCLKLPQD